tara:strand:- start:50726 stop:50932 length:207 start_codon:yes stop_codon:yes gene_type:complete
MATQKELAFEDAMEQLEMIVSQLERGDLPLDKSLEAFEKGASYVKQCQDKLSAAEMRIEKIMKTKEEK